MADAVQEIKDRLSIEDLVSQYVQLKKVGRSLKGLCPFHSEKTPSFIVSPERQIAYCFGCNKGGDLFTFIQEVEGVDFSDAKKILAEKTGVKLESYTSSHPKVTGNQREQMLDMYNITASFYEQKLWDTKTGEKVLEYLYIRGLTEESIREFRLGFSPDSFEETYKYLIGKGFTRKMLVSGGLSISKETTVEKIYDRFRGRLMFPILDSLGRVVAFGGRALGKDQEPKYLNSPETAIYHKSNILYGYYNSKPKLKEKKEALIVEGYFDVIAAFQAGCRNTVAPCGTALASGQLRILKPFAEDIVLAFDMDLAGQEAAKRAYEVAQEFDFNIKVVELPDSKDPAEFVKNHGNELMSVVDKALPYNDYIYNGLIKAYGTDTFAAKKRILKDFIPHFHLFKSTIEKDEYVRKLAHDLDMKEVQIYDEIKSYKLPHNHPARRHESLTKENKSEKLIKMKASEILLGLMLEFPRVGKLYIKKIGENFFSDELKPIYKAFFDKYNSDSSEADGDVIAELPHELKENASLISLFVIEKYGEISEESVEKEIIILVEKVQRGIVTTKRSHLQKKLIEAEKDCNKDLCEKLLKELNGLYEQIATK